jgi:hypothetical protein
MAHIEEEVGAGGGPAIARLDCRDSSSQRPRLGRPQQPRLDQMRAAVRELLLEIRQHSLPTAVVGLRSCAGE